MSTPINGFELCQTALGWPGVNKQTLKASFDLYNESVIMTRYENGEAITSYEVSSKDLAAALSGQQITTGLLPRNCLFYGFTGQNERIGIYQPPSKKTLTVQFYSERQITIPLPGLVFFGVGLNYYIFAVKNKWPEEKDRLFKAPFPNVYRSGKVCVGNVSFPICSPKTIHHALELFLSSGFNRDLSDMKSKTQRNNVLHKWATLQGAEQYPLNDLYATNLTLKDIINADPTY